MNTYLLDKCISHLVVYSGVSHDEGSLKPGIGSRTRRACLRLEPLYVYISHSQPEPLTLGFDLESQFNTK